MLSGCVVAPYPEPVVYAPPPPAMDSTGPKGPQTMKMRYTHLGPCRGKD